MPEKAIAEPEDSLAKRILLFGGETANVMKVSYLLGLGLAAGGRAGKAEWLPLVPPGLDIIGGFQPTPAKAACYIAYGAGVATAYADKIYSFAADIVDKLIGFVLNL